MTAATVPSAAPAPRPPSRASAWRAVAALAALSGVAGVVALALRLGPMAWAAAAAGALAALGGAALAVRRSADDESTLGAQGPSRASAPAAPPFDAPGAPVGRSTTSGASASPARVGDFAPAPSPAQAAGADGAVAAEATAASAGDEAARVAAFLATAAHELKTPLTSIVGFADLLADPRADDRRRRDAAAILQRQAQAMQHMVEELLALARLDAQRSQPPALAPTALRQVVEHAADAMRRPGAAPRVRLHIAADAPWVAADAPRLQQAVQNLLGNALKYSAEASEVQVYVAPRAGRDGRAGCSVRVVDQGVGMTDAQCAHAFDRFWRADPHGSVAGAGLGLALVREIVTLHGGHVALHSAPGLGTEAVMWLPTCAAPLDTLDAPHDPDSSAAQAHAAWQALRSAMTNPTTPRPAAAPPRATPKRSQPRDTEPGPLA